MPKVIFRLADGDRREVDVPVGESIMHAAVGEGIPGVIGECGGEMTCATCHVRIPDEWQNTFVAADDEETDLLDIIDDPTPNSRLGCQLRVTEEHEGLEVEVPRS